MGEICKGPQTSKKSEISDPETVKAVLMALIESEGLAPLIRKIQYALEDLSKRAQTGTEGTQPGSNAEKYSRAAETLEEPYNVIKNEIKL